MLEDVPVGRARLGAPWQGSPSRCSRSHPHGRPIPRIRVVRETRGRGRPPKGELYVESVVGHPCVDGDDARCRSSGGGPGNLQPGHQHGRGQRLHSPGRPRQLSRGCARPDGGVARRGSLGQGLRQAHGLGPQRHEQGVDRPRPGQRHEGHRGFRSRREADDRPLRRPLRDAIRPGLHVGDDP